MFAVVTDSLKDSGLTLTMMVLLDKPLAEGSLSNILIRSHFKLSQNSFPVTAIQLRSHALRFLFIQRNIIIQLNTIILYFKLLWNHFV